MKKYVVYFVLIWSFAFISNAWSVNINDLLRAADKQPGAYVTKLSIQENKLEFDRATGELFPKIGLFAKAENYNSPTNARPMTPTEINVAAGDSIPFSRNLLKYGIQFNMPIYSKKIYELRNELKLLTRNAKINHQINLTTRQAMVVSLNSSFNYIVELKKAILSRIKSLEKTRYDTKIMVNNGRLPEVALLKIDNQVIELNQQLNDLELKLIEVKANLKKITGIDLESPVPMRLISTIEKKGDFIEVKKRKVLLNAAKGEIDLKKAAYYPVISLYGFVTRRYGTAYNTDDHFHRNYNSVGVSISMPLFDKPAYTSTQIARVKLQKAQKQLEDTKIQLRSLEQSLKNRLPVVKDTIRLEKKSVSTNKQLLKVAKVALKIGRQTMEDYLQYESQLLSSEAKLKNAVDQKWQIISQLSILYGIRLQGVIK